MKINIFGLGYVGCVSAACLASNGHDITGIDIDDNKVSIINSGKSPIVEEGLGKLIKNAVIAGKLRATVNNIQESDISIICVGTPSNDNGSLDLSYLTNAFEQIGRNLTEYSNYHVIINRSTVLPGTINEILIPILEKQSAKKAGVDFGVCMNPEFMREGTSVYDYYNPPFTLIGQLDEVSGRIVADIYQNINAPTLFSSIKVAEMVKYASNSFHALKVTFANEIGNICKKLKIDSHEVMDIFCKDTKLNISNYYLKPGFAFGGSCLPKDLRAILYKSKELDLETPILSSIIASNNLHIESVSTRITKAMKKNIGILGLSFKAGTDDLRESPMVELIERLIGKGYNVSIFDKEVSMAKIFGSNKKYINTFIPHISSLIRESISEIFDNSDLIIIGKKNYEYKEAIQKFGKNKLVIDLVRIFSNSEETTGEYDGICW